MNCPSRGFSRVKRRRSFVFRVVEHVPLINTPFGSAHSENGYAAEGKHFAAGANFSEAGVEIKFNGGHKGGKKPDGKWGGKGGNMWPGKGGNGGMGGHPGGGKPTSISVRVFAGGFSFAKAH